jgi:hypothetical protein
MARDRNQRLVEGLRSRFLAGTEQTALAYTYHTSDFVVTGNVTHPLGGNGSILVSKVTGTVEVVGSALPIFGSSKRRTHGPLRVDSHHTIVTDNVGRCRRIKYDRTEAMDREHMRCRRKNYVQAAYVEAAVHINQVFGSDRAYWILIRENVPQAVIGRVLRGEPGRVRRKDRRYATRRATILEPEVAALERRKDHMTSQRIEVALVFESMLGVESAKEYLRDAGVPIWVTERVLTSTKRRPSPVLAAE